MTHDWKRNNKQIMRTYRKAKRELNNENDLVFQACTTLGSLAGIVLGVGAAGYALAADNDNALPYIITGTVTGQAIGISLYSAYRFANSDFYDEYIHGFPEGLVWKINELYEKYEDKTKK